MKTRKFLFLFLLLFIGDVLHVDPSIIPKIFQIIYDSEGHSVSHLLSSPVVHSQVYFINPLDENA